MCSEIHTQSKNFEVNEVIFHPGCTSTTTRSAWRSCRLVTSSRWTPTASATPSWSWSCCPSASSRRPTIKAPTCRRLVFLVKKSSFILVYLTISVHKFFRKLYGLYAIDISKYQVFVYTHVLHVVTPPYQVLTSTKITSNNNPTIFGNENQPNNFR